MLVQMERQIDREIAADNLANTAAGSELNSTDGQESDTDSENDRDADGVLLVYGPHRQIVTNDLKSLDEMVSLDFDLLSIHSHVFKTRMFI